MTDSSSDSDAPSVRGAGITAVTAPLLMHGGDSEDAFEEISAAVTPTRVRPINRYLEERITYEPEHPKLRRVASGLALSTFLLSAVLWFGFDGAVTNSYTVRGLSPGWVVVAVCAISTGVVGVLSDGVERTVEIQRRRDSYYPPKEYWDDIDHFTPPQSTRDADDED